MDNSEDLSIEDEFKDSNYCYLAYNGFNINANKSDCMPCCGIDTNFWEHADRPSKISLVDAINNEQLIDIRRKLTQNEWPLPCSHCKVAEEKGFLSMRRGWNGEHTNLRMMHNGDIPPYLNTQNEYIQPENVSHIEIGFDNVCNSKCMTCGSSASSLWRDEEIAIWGEPESDGTNLILDNATITEIVNQCINLKFINIYGGEPTVSDQHRKFITKLVESGRAPNIQLQMVTNLSNITDEYIKLWEHFKSISLTVSIDGFQSVNEYIRYPFKWTKTTKNLERIKNLSMEQPDRYSFSCSTTISVFNAHDVIDLMVFWDQYTHNHLHLNRVTNPDYTAIEMLSEEYKQKCIENIDNKLSTLQRENTISRAKEVKAWLLEKHNKPEARLVKKLVKLVEESDKFRNRSLSNYIPHLYEEILKLKNSNIIL